MERVNRKEIEEKVRKTSIVKRQIITAGWYEVKGKRSIHTAINGCNLQETIDLLKEEFNNASKKLGVPVESIIVEKSKWSSSNAHLTASRLETDEEIERRIEHEVNYRVLEIQETKKRASAEKYRKKKQIEKLQKELEELQK